jgi:hypothetical protein
MDEESLQKNQRVMEAWSKALIRVLGRSPLVGRVP